MSRLKTSYVTASVIHVLLYIIIWRSARMQGWVEMSMKVDGRLNERMGHL